MRWLLLAAARATAVVLLCVSCASTADGESNQAAVTSIPTEAADIPTTGPAKATAVPTEAVNAPAASADVPSAGWTCANQEPRDVAADTELSSELEALLGPGVPGMVAATVSSDGLLHIGSAGVRALDSDEPMQPTDRMHLGSDTKAMTATLLGLLAGAGDIEFTTLVTDVWPDADTGWDAVSLLDLLRHRGGAEDNLPGDRSDLWNELLVAAIRSHELSGTERALAAQTARSEFAAALTATAPAEPVGQFAYSGAGYMLVGAAMEARLDTPWEELMCQHLFRPLAMDGCGFGAPPAPGPSGHTGNAGELKAVDPTTPFADNPPARGPSGTVYCPVADWGRYLSWVLRGARGDDDLLPASAWDVLLEPEGDYAAGWRVAELAWSNGTVYHHSGSNRMWFALTRLAPGLDRAFLVATNAGTQAARSAGGQGIAVLLEMES